MINMLRADFYRLVRSIWFYAAILFLLVMIVPSIYFVEPGYIGMSGSAQSAEAASEIQGGASDMSYDELRALSSSEFREVMLETEGYEFDRALLSSNMNLYYLFIFFAVIILTVDFSGSSVKNTLTSAISRNKYYCAKFIFISICCTAVFFLNTYIIYFANILFNGENLASSLGTVTKISLLQLPVMLALASILTGIGFAVKKTSIFNTITIPFIIVCQLILNLAVTIFKIKEEYLYYELQLMIGKLAYDPSNSYILHSFLVCAVVIIVFNVLGYLSFKKAEIK